MTRLVHLLLAVSVAASTFTVGLVGSVGLSATSAGAAEVGLESQFVTFMNARRTAAGQSPLAFNAALFDVARAWTDHLVATNTLADDAGVASAVPAGWARVGENTGAGSSLSQVDDSFWQSPVHRSNILGDYDAVGVGVDRRADGTVFATAVFVKWQPGAPAASYSCPGARSGAAPSIATATGYELLGAGGVAAAFDNAPSLGSVGGRPGAAAIAATRSGRGYWVLDSQGGVAAFGDAQYFGSGGTGGGAIDAVDLKPTPSGDGYWILARDGSVFAFGSARSFGSLPAIHVGNEAIKLLPTPTGGGYWILGSDGGVFSFGDAAFHGSVPGLGIHDPSVAVAATPTGDGYWILGADGGIFSFGDAAFHGSVPGLGCRGIGVELAPTRDGGGYYVLSMDGRVFAFGDAPALGQPPTAGTAAVDLGVVAF